MKQCSIHVTYPEQMNLFHTMRSINRCINLAQSDFHL